MFGVLILLILRVITLDPIILTTKIKNLCAVSVSQMISITSKICLIERLSLYVRSKASPSEILVKFCDITLESEDFSTKVKFSQLLGKNFFLFIQR